MSEIEDTTESLHEKIHEEAHEAEHDPKGRWILYVALFTAFIAALAAITGMLSGDNENEALISQLKASDQWALYQAKGIKSEIVSLTSKAVSDPKEIDESKERMATYKEEQSEIKQEAEALQIETQNHLSKHVKLARGVMMFQICIAISAISILTRRKLFWYVAMVFALCGCFFLSQGLG